MIISAEEFKRLRTSENLEEQRFSAQETAEVSVWFEVIEKFPELKVWVAHNKTIQLEVLEFLAKDQDEKVRSSIARKRKINQKIFDLLKNDRDENVRYALLSNTKLSLDMKKEVKVDDSEWLMKELNEKLQ